MMDRFEQEYLREEREWKLMEEKLQPETVDCRKCKVLPSMRKWFREKFGFMADDRSIKKRWEER